MLRWTVFDNGITHQWVTEETNGDRFGEKFVSCNGSFNISAMKKTHQCPFLHDVSFTLSIALIFAASTTEAFCTIWFDVNDQAEKTKTGQHIAAWIKPPPICKRHLACTLSEEKACGFFYQNFTEVCSNGSCWQYFTIYLFHKSHNALTHNAQSTRTNNKQVSWRYMALRRNELTWRRNQMETGEFHSQRTVTRSFDVFFDLRLNKRLSKQLRPRRFETPSLSLWRHCNGIRSHEKNINSPDKMVWASHHKEYNFQTMCDVTVKITVYRLWIMILFSSSPSSC